MPDQPLLAVENLSVTQPGTGRVLVAEVSFQVMAGRTLALVGESGSGKTLTMRAVMGLLPRGLQSQGRMQIAGVDTPRGAPAKLRGSTIALMMQDPFTLLNPLRTVAYQLGLSFRHLPKAKVRAEIETRLAEVGLAPDVAQRYPWQLSGGQRQRVGIAAALARDPRIVIADEPTTALDVTTQRDVLLLLQRLQHEREMAIVLITHDLPVALSVSDEVAVLDGGRLVELASPEHIQHEAKAAMTQRLLAATPSFELEPRDEVKAQTKETVLESAEAQDSVLTQDQVILRAHDVGYRYPGSEELVLQGMTCEVTPGLSLGIVGESGSGKSTFARCMAGLATPSEGELFLDGQELTPAALQQKAFRAHRLRTVQLVFQDPYSTLNPMRSIGSTLAEALQANAQPHHPEAVAALLTKVGLDPAFERRRPAALSGGQRQRVAIARAIAGQPKILVCDEAVSALDVTVQAQILDLLKDLQREMGLALVFITHDLAVAQQITDEVLVLQHGRLVESGPTDVVLRNPEQAYTRELVAAVPQTDPAWLTQSG